MRISVRSKLFGAFGVVIALMVVLGVVAVGKLGSVSDRAQALGVGSVASVDTIGRVRHRVSNVVRVQNAATFADPSKLADLKRERDELQADGTKLLGDYDKLQSDGRDGDQWKAAQAAWDHYIAASKGVFTALEDGDKAKALGILTASQDKFTALDDKLQAWAQYNRKLAGESAADAASTYTSARTLMIVLMLAAGVLGLALAVLIARAIVGGISQMARAADGIAEGDVDQDVNITSRDELGDTGEAFGRMIEYLKEMSSTADRVAAGDLTVTVNPRSERDLLGNTFKRLVHDLGEIVSGLSREAETVSSASQQMASTSEETGRAVGEIASAISDVAQGAERQVRMVESTRDAVQEAARAATASAETATATTAAADQARTAARDGVDAAERASEAIRQVANASSQIGEAIDELSTKSERIGGIVDTITGIAEQTNLLALNAAIEAARAGEQGKGFAVVAEEVRKLAEESQSAAAQISSLIGEMQTETVRVVDVVSDGARRTEEGVATVEQTREAFQDIGLAVEDMNVRVAEIAAAVEQINSEARRAESDIAEVASVAEESSASSEQVSASTQQTSASTQEIAASAQSLAGTAEELNRLIQRFQLTA
jgi:methyl-accepting chemotaxis protein